VDWTRLRLFGASVAFALMLPACLFRKNYPPQPVVAEVEIQGNSAVDTSGLLEGLATTESERFLGIWDGVAFEYEIYDPDLLSKDLERVERFLKRRGYYEAKVVAARVIPKDAHRVRIEIRVTEGAPVVTREVTPHGLETLPIAVSAETLRDNPLRPGEPFDEDQYETSKKRLLEVLRDAGYAFASVKGSVTIDVARHEARVEYQIAPGVPAVYGPIQIVGLKEVPEAKVRATLAIRTGAPYSQSELRDAERALVNLNVFSAVQVRPLTREATGTSVPIAINIEETRLRTVQAGGGVQLDSLQLSNHLTVGWEDRNFLGGLRRFEINAKPGLVYYPTRFGNLTPPDRALFQQRVTTTLRQPSFVEGRTTGFVSGSFSVTPLLYADSEPGDGILGFSEVRASSGVERAFWDHRLFVSPSFNGLLALPVDYVPLTIGRSISAADELLTDLLITYPELLLSLDFRDDRVQPSKGALFSASAQVASRVFGSDVNDVRLRPEARFYVPISKRVIFATRFTTGFLYAQNYSETLNADEGQFTDGQVARDQQKLLFRGFFSGGPNSNRGYALRGVGPHGDVRFLTRNIDCAAEPTAHDCNRPLGGVAMWEASMEVRFVILGPLGGVTFIDSSNVARQMLLDFTRPHLSAGGGFRYGTPIGPVRLDVGYRLPFAQNLSGARDEESPAPLLGLPIAVHLTLGEAF
jgi:outer membrane protein insertion porin family/translocation and assembly module TamA